jgi:hypothetical protein
VSVEDWVKAGMVAIRATGELCMLFYVWSLTPGSRRAMDHVLAYDAYALQDARHR